MWFRESRSWNGNVEKAGAFFAVREIRNSHDGVEAEVFPIYQISDVPPAMHMVANACGDLINQIDCWVWSCQVLHNGRCRPIEAELGSEITILGRYRDIQLRRSKIWQYWQHSVRTLRWLGEVDGTSAVIRIAIPSQRNNIHGRGGSGSDMAEGSANIG